MATKSKKTTKKKGFQFRWWYAAILILVVAIVGIAVLRFSQAKGDYSSITNQTVTSKAQPYGVTVLGLTNGNWAYVRSVYGNGWTWQRHNADGGYACAHIYKGSYFKDGGTAQSYVFVGDTVTVKEYNGVATQPGYNGCAY